ncbi:MULTISPECIES: hypothetical protein [unclassified Mycobacterium]|uniref:hypothetical protein n=1 Tax=unclassified Mycobacterium TaxID=2642494 RepID=UPI0029C80A5B|nr:MULTISPECIES: hypothetical protein [unclassified Mycobacterium]
MPAKMSFRNARSALSKELAAVREREPDLDAGDVTVFSIPLVLGLVGVLAIGVVPLIVVRSSAETDAVLIPLAGSFALTAICAAVVAWLTANVLSGVVVMGLYRTRPRAASKLVIRTMLESFYRIEDLTGRIALLAVVAGLLSVAIGLPRSTGPERATSVLDDLLTAQVACLVVALSIAFLAESIRCAADIVDDQSLLLAWPWALLIAVIGWSLSTVIGPFETTRMLEILLNDWLPPFVDGTPRAELIADLLPPSARWWAAFGPLPLIVALWAYLAWREEGLLNMRRAFADDASTLPR